MKNNTVFALALLFIFTSSLAFGVKKEIQPNVIVIMTDDQLKNITI